MNPTILIRFVAATFVATTLGIAQSAPVRVVRVVREGDKAKAEGRPSDRVQVRLAEVIAMLEEDDLSPEQRSAAKKKLEEIVKKLREQPPAAAGPAVVAPVAPPPRAFRALSVDRLEAPKDARVEVVFRTQEPTAPTPGKPSKRVAPTQSKEEPREVRGQQARAGEWRVEVSEGQHEHVDTRRPVRLEKLDGAIAVKPMGEWVEVTRATKAHAEADRARAAAEKMREKAEAARESAEAARDRALQYVRSAQQEARNQDAAERSRVLFRRASDAKSAVPAMPGRERARTPPDDDDIRAMIEELRAEMREIRGLLQQLRKQSQANASGPKAGLGLVGAVPGFGLGKGNSLPRASDPARFPGLTGIRRPLAAQSGEHGPATGVAPLQGVSGLEDLTQGLSRRRTALSPLDPDQGGAKPVGPAIGR